MDKFKLGDVVVLKSGGPAMTISEKVYDYGTETGKWECKWFQDNQSKVDTFHQDTLELDEE